MILLVASVRVILHHHGSTSGSLIIDDTDNPRSKSAHTRAHLYKLRDKESGGYIWGQSLVFLVLVTPKISIPVGFTCYRPGSHQCLVQTGKGPQKARCPQTATPPEPPPHPLYPPKQQLALRLLAAIQDGPSGHPRALYRGGCALWHRAFCRWRLGPFRRGASHLASTEQSEYPGASARAAPRRLFCRSSRHPADYPHPGR